MTFHLSPRRAAVAVITMVVALGAAAPQPASKKSPGEPTLVTLHYTNAPADVVLKDLFDQMGSSYTKNNAAGTWPTISIDADKLPYWNVVAMLEDKNNFNLLPNAASRSTVANLRTANAPNPIAGPSCIAGPCMITVRQLVSSVTLTDVNTEPNCRLEIMLRAEPQMHIALYTSRVQPDLAVDENGHSLLGAPPAPVSVPAGGIGQPQLEIPLQPPPTAGHKIALLKGAMHVSVFDKVQTFDIPAGDFGQTRNLDILGANLEISPITPQTTNGAATTNAPPDLRLTMRLTRNGLADEDWKKANELLDAVDLQVFDIDNKPYTQSGSGGGTGTNERLRTAGFRATSNTPARTPMGAAGRCLIIVPQTLRDVPLAYEFKDLPLP